MILNRIFFTVMVKFAALKLHQNCRIGIDLSFTLLLSDNSMYVKYYLMCIAAAIPRQELNLKFFRVVVFDKWPLHVCIP